MRPKGIKFIELIADKIFVSVFALIFLAIVALQFLGGGTTVKVGASENLPISRAYEEIVTKALGKQAQMNSNEIPADIPAAPPNVVAALEEVISAPRTTTAGIPWVSPVLIDSDAKEIAPDMIGRFTLPLPPALTSPVATVAGGALDPFVLIQTPELSQYLLNGPSEQPYDLFVISVQAGFDVAGYRARLDADPDGAGPLSPIPNQWWRNRLDVLDVQVYRRQVFADGERGPEALLPPPPGSATLRGSLGDELTVTEFNSRVQFAGVVANAKQIREPRFFRMIAGEPWIPPMDAAAADQPVSDPRLAELQSVRRDIAEVQDRLDQLKKQARSGGGGGQVVAGRQPGGLGGGDRGRGKTSRPESSLDARRKEQIQQLTARLQELQSSEKRLIAELLVAGIDPETGRRADVTVDLSAEPLPMRDADRITVWSHDVSARPGETYEYRVRLVLPNPLKGYEQNMPDDQRALAVQSVIESDFSPWSAPIEAPRRAYMFVEGVSMPEIGALGATRPSATIELYRFFYGYWRKGQLRVTPGDSIGASIALPAPLPLWTISEGLAEQSGEHQAPIEARSGAYLLDVVTEPSPATPGPANREPTRLAAMIAEPNGTIAVRRPEEDRTSSLRNKLDASVEAGLNAMTTAPTPGPAARPAAGSPSGGAPASGRRTGRLGG